VRATARAIRYRVDVNNLDHLASDTVAMNEIAEVEFETNLPLFFDSYRECADGIADPYRRADQCDRGRGHDRRTGRGSCGRRAGRSKRRGAHPAAGRGELAVRVRDALAARGERALVIDDALIPDSAVPAVVRALQLAGVIAVSSRMLAQATIAEIEGFGAGGVRVEDGADEEAIVKAWWWCNERNPRGCGVRGTDGGGAGEAGVREATGAPICLTSSFQTEDMWCCTCCGSIFRMCR